MSTAVRRLLRDMSARDASAGREDSPTQGADSHVLRAYNRLLVLNCVREHGPLARVAVADRTGLSRTTVSSIMDTLLREGLVREGSALRAAPSGGRRAIQVHFNADAGYVLGIDLGRTHLTLLLTSLGAEPVARRSLPFDANQGPECCLPLLIAEVRALLDEQHIAWDRVLGVGLGIPGPMDAGLRVLVAPPSMPGWDGVDVGGRLQDELAVPVYIDNDANMGALGESRFGAGRGVADLAYIKIGTGIGGGFIIRGHIYRGSCGSAGELGHVSIDEDGPPCACGNRGCLEAVAGAPAIVADARRASTAAAPVPSASGDADIMGVIEAARRGDEASLAALERAGEHIAVALADLINLLNPSLILVDGGVARAGELLLAPLRRAVATRCLPVAWARTRIMPGALGDTAIALGAVSTVIDAAFGAPGRPAAPTAVPPPALAGTGSPVG